jgi:hypothetical protein
MTYLWEWQINICKLKQNRTLKYLVNISIIEANQFLARWIKFRSQNMGDKLERNLSLCVKLTYDINIAHCLREPNQRFL